MEADTAKSNQATVFTVSSNFQVLLESAAARELTLSFV